MSSEFSLGQLFYPNYTNESEIPKGVHDIGSIICLRNQFYIATESGWELLDMVSKTPYDQLLDYLGNMNTEDLQKLYKNLDILGIDIEKIILSR